MAYNKDEKARYERPKRDDSRESASLENPSNPNLNQDAQQSMSRNAQPNDNRIPTTYNEPNKDQAVPLLAKAIILFVFIMIVIFFLKDYFSFH